jgi:hypothetical protein
MEAIAVEQQKIGRETVIEEAILRQPDLLGYPDAQIIRHCRIGPDSGLVDLVLLPKDGPVRLVLVEAKACDAHDAASKCVGQLLMYYADALRLGSHALDLMRSYAKTHLEQAVSKSKISHKMLTNKSSVESWPLMSSGQLLAPSDLRLFLALDGEPRHALEPLLGCLRDRHNLKIGLVVVRDGAIVRVAKPD